MPTKKKPEAKKAAGKPIKEKAKAPTKKAAPAKAKLAPAKAAAPAKKVAPEKKPTKAAAKAVPEAKGKKPKASLKELEKSSNKFSDEELDEDMEFQDEEEEEIVAPRAGRKAKQPRFDADAEEEITDADLSFEDAEGVVGEDALDAAEPVELEEDDVEEGREGPPPWWKDDPAGIEPEGDEPGSRAQFDDSDEWSEEDEDWASKRGSFDDVEDAGDEEDSW